MKSESIVSKNNILVNVNFKNNYSVHQKSQTDLSKLPAINKNRPYLSHLLWLFSIDDFLKYFLN